MILCESILDDGGADVDEVSTECDMIRPVESNDVDDEEASEAYRILYERIIRL